MLNPLCKAQPVHVNGQVVPVIKTVTGLHLAKATVKYPAQQRAQDAAAWLRGEVAVAADLETGRPNLSRQHPIGRAGPRAARTSRAA